MSFFCCRTFHEQNINLMSTLSFQSFILQAYPFLSRSRIQLRSYAATTTGRSHSYPTRSQAQKSLQLTIKELMVGDMPNDVGLLPGRYSESHDSIIFVTVMKWRKYTDISGTFIMPTGAAKPSIFREPRLRWKLEVFRLKARFEDIRGYYAFS